MEGNLVNMTDGGEGNTRPSREQIASIVLSNKTRGVSDETKERITKALSGKQLSQETKDKMSLMRKGKPHSDTHRQRLSLKNKLRFGKINTEEYETQLKLIG